MREEDVRPPPKMSGQKFSNQSKSNVLKSKNLHNENLLLFISRSESSLLIFSVAFLA